MMCPRDGCALDKVEFAGVEMDSCAYCDSAWLDAGELRALHQLETDLLGEAGLEASDPRGVIACPRCATSMRTRYFSDARRVIVDQCVDCKGVWLDTSELKAILNEAWQRRTPCPPLRPCLGRDGLCTGDEVSARSLVSARDLGVCVSGFIVIRNRRSSLLALRL